MPDFHGFVNREKTSIDDGCVALDDLPQVVKFSVKMLAGSYIA